MFTLPELPYAYGALEGVISERIMRLHHDKHHQTYVNKLNAALQSHPELQNKTIEELLQGLNELPDDIRTAVRNNGGGHYNHSLFWQWLTPDDANDNPNDGALKTAIEQRYGSVEAFKYNFAIKAAGVFGSGWVWLMPNLDIITTANQDSPLMDGQPAPILGLDVWEHAYYLDYENRRDDYITQWWRVVNWDEAEKRYAAATA